MKLTAKGRLPSGKLPFFEKCKFEQFCAARAELAGAELRFSARPGLQTMLRENREGSRNLSTATLNRAAKHREREALRADLFVAAKAATYKALFDLTLRRHKVDTADYKMDGGLKSAATKSKNTERIKHGENQTRRGNQKRRENQKRR